MIVATHLSLTFLRHHRYWRHTNFCLKKIRSQWCGDCVLSYFGVVIVEFQPFRIEFAELRDTTSLVKRISIESIESQSQHDKLQS